MSHVIHCDGSCGFNSKDPKDFEKIGTVYPNEYCKSCSKLAHSYTLDVDNLQEKLQAQWTKEFTRIKKRHGKIMSKGGVLPDEPV